MRTYTTLIIFIIFAIGSFWLLQDTNKQTTEDQKSASRFPDYFMENFSITNLDIKGQPESVLQAKKMLHYADDDSAELELPFLKVIRENSSVTLRAEHATFFKQENTLYLRDNVIIHRAASHEASQEASSQAQTELTIYTDYLKINTLTNIAETDKAAKIKTPQAEITSMGLIFDNKKATLKLNSKVKGIYETTH